MICYSSMYCGRAKVEISISHDGVISSEKIYFLESNRMNSLVTSEQCCLRQCRCREGWNSHHTSIEHMAVRMRFRRLWHMSRQRLNVVKSFEDANSSNKSLC